MTSVKLKNGTVTQDSRLTRLENFDERSREYPISELVSDKFPRSYTWRCNEWFDQGREGACVGFALGHEAASRPAEFKGLTFDYLVENVYHEAQKIDPWPGGVYPGGDPQYEGTSVLAGIKVMKKIGFFKSYRWAFGLEDLVLGVGYNGPAVLGVRWYEGMYKPDENGFIQPSGSIMGGHALLARAVNVKKGYFTLRNSWGRTWGIDGDCYITFEDMGKLLEENGEAAFMINRTSKVQL